eukprot:TRINITY_DN6950_c0_g3_i1.p1 TRINITY_DN6950_c0_g3~~TRINITY_DN6950_c0_g3_i1.p1  ORF type:complete len:3719 (+),score=1247.43 TRINITY_DN6950_c0_g3_i1:123-11279(+)
MNKIIAPLVAKYTAQYIEGIDSDNLNLGVFSGSIELSNLRLKRSALAELDLPVDVVRGCLGKLQIRIPWTNLSGQAVVAKVDELLLLVKPKTFGTRVQYVEIAPRKSGTDEVCVGGIELLGEKDRVLSLAAAYTVSASGKRTRTDLIQDGLWGDKSWSGSAKDTLLLELTSTECVKGYRVRSAGGHKGVRAWGMRGALAPHAEAHWHVLHNAQEGGVELPEAAGAWSPIVRDLEKPDLKELRRQVVTSKREELAAYDELLKQQQESKVVEGKTKASSFTERLQETIISNLQIDIQSIHVRFEDDVTSPGDVYTMGVCLNSLKVFSTSESWERSFISAVGDVVHKAVNVEDFGVYMDHSKVLTHELEHEKWKDLMLESLSRRHTYLLTPLTLQTHLKMLTLKGRTRLGHTQPLIDLSVDSEELEIGVNRAQYVSLLKVLQFMQSYNVLAKYTEYRPSAPVMVSPKLWWHFMRRCIVKSIREQRKTTDNTRNGKLKLAAEYIEAYKQMQDVPWLEKLDPASAKYKKYDRILEAYEYFLPTQELKTFRQEASVQLAAGRKRYEELEKDKAARVAEKKKKQSWTDWMYGVKVEDDKDHSMQMDQEARDQLMTSIGWDDDDDTVTEDIVQSLESDHVTTVMNLNVRNLKLQLNETRKSPIGCVHFRGTAMMLHMRKEGLDTTLTLQDFDINDATTGNKIIAVREKGSALLDIEYQMPPLDHRADSSLKLSGGGLDVWFTPPWLCRVMSLFQVPPTINLSSLEAATTAALAGFSTGATRGLMLALEERKSIALDVNIVGPRLFVPYHSNAAGRMEINSGTFTLTSDVDNSRKARISSGQDIKDEDYYSRMRFTLKGVSASFCAADAPTDIVDKAHDPRRYIVSDVALGLSLDSCLTPEAPDKPSLILNGNVGCIDVSVSHMILADLLTSLDTVLAWVSNVTGTVADPEKEGLLWAGEVQALPPAFIDDQQAANARRPSRGPVEGSASDTSWTTYQAQYIPATYQLVLTVLDAQDEVPVVVKIGVLTRISLKGDTIVITLPQGKMSNTAVVDVHVRVADEAERQRLYEMMCESRWERSSYAHDREINRLKYMEAEQKVSEHVAEHTNMPNTKVNLQCQLEVPHVFLNLLDDSSVPMSKVGISNLAVHFQQRPKDMSARLSLSTFSMLDLRRSGTDDVFLGLLSDAGESYAGNQDKQCIEFFYEAAEEGSPMPFVAEGTGMRLQLNCGALVLDSERTTLPPLLGYLMMYGNVHSSTRHAITYEESKPIPKKNDTKVEGWFGATQQKKAEPATEIRATMKTLETRFRNNGDLVFSARATSSQVGLRMVPEASLIFTATLGNFALEYHPHDKSEVYSSLVSCNDDESTLQVKYTQDYTVSLSPTVPQYSAGVSIILGQCNIVYLQRTIAQLQRYFDVGYIMQDMPVSQALTVAADAAYGAALAAQQMAKQAAEDRAKSLSLMQIELVVSRPTLVVPYSVTTTDHAEFVMGTLRFNTSLQEKPVKGGQGWIELMDIQLVDSSLQLNDKEMEQKGRIKSIIDDWSFTCQGERAVVNPNSELPFMKLSSTVGDMRLTLTKAQYEALMVILNANVLDTWMDERMAVVTSASPTASSPASPESPAAGQTSAFDPAAGTQEGTSLHFDLTFNNLSFRMEVDRQDAEYIEAKPLLAAHLTGLHLFYESKNNGEQAATVGLNHVGVVDTRTNASPYANKLFWFGSPDDSVSRPLMVMNDTRDKQDIEVHLPPAYVTLLPELLGDLMRFFVSEVSAQYERERRERLRAFLSVAKSNGDIYMITQPWWKLTEDLYLGPQHRLLVKLPNKENGRIVIDADGHNVFLTGNCTCTSALQPPHDVQEYCIVAGKNVTLIFRNAKVYCQRSLNDYVLPGSGKVLLDRSSRLYTPATSAVAATAPPSSKEMSLTVNMPKGFTVLMPERPHILNSRMLILIIDGQATMTTGQDGPGSSFINFSSKNIGIFPTKLGNGKGHASDHQRIHNVLGPAQLRFIMQSRMQRGVIEQDIVIDGENFIFRFSYQDIKSATLLANYVTEHLITSQNAQAHEEPLLLYHPEVYTLPPLDSTPGQEHHRKQADVKITPITTNINVKFNTFSMLVVDDKFGYDRSLLRLVLMTSSERPYALQTKLSKQVLVDGTSSVTGSLSLLMTLEFFNDANMNWEPIIEPHSVTITVEQAVSLGATESRLQLDSDDLSLSVSSEMVRRLTHVSGDWMADLQKVDAAEEERPKQYVVNNHTGLTVTLRGAFTSDTVQITSKPLAFDADDQGSVDMCVDFAAAGMRPLKLLESEKYQVFQVPAALLRQNERLVYAITEKRKGQLFMTLGSRYLVANMTSVQLEMRLENEVIPLPPYKEGSREHEVAIPLWALRNGENPGMCVRSMEERHKDYRWSTCGSSLMLPVVPSGKNVVQKGSFVCGYVGKTDNVGSIAFSYTRVIRDTQCFKENSKLHVIVIQAPILLENTLPVPVEASFHHAHKVHRGLKLGPGESQEILTVTLDEDVYVSFEVIAPECGQNFSPSDPKCIQSSSDSNATLQNHEHVISVRDRSSKREVFLKLDVTGVNTTRARREICLYVPYWMVNLTKRDIFFVKDHDGAILCQGFVNKDMSGSGRAPPLLFSGTLSDPFGGKLSLAHATNPTAWGQAFQYDVVGVPGETRVNDQDYEYRYGVSIELAPGAFSRTKMVKLIPRWVFVNNSKVAVAVLRYGGMRHVYQPGEQDDNVAFPIKHPRDVDEDLELALIGEEFANYTKSNKLNFAQLGTHHLVMRHKVLPPVVIDCQVTQLGSSNYVVFKDATAPPLRFVNNTFNHVTVVEVPEGAKPGKREVVTMLSPWSMTPFYPIRASGKAPKVWLVHNPSVDATPDLFTEVELQIGGREYYGLGGDFIVRVDFGQDCLLCVIEHRSMRRRATVIGNLSSSVLAVNTSLGVSMITSEGIVRRELAYLFLGGVTMEVKQKLETLDLTLGVHTIQLDDQMHNPMFETILTSDTVGRVKRANNTEKRDAFTMNLIDYSTRIGGMTTMTSFSFLLQELEITIDDMFLFELLSYMMSLGGTETQAQDLEEEMNKAMEYLLVFDEELHGGRGSGKFYAGELILNPIKLVLTYKAENDVNPSNPLVKTAMNTLSMSVTSIEESPLKLSALILRPANGKVSDVSDIIFVHYRNCALKAAFNIIGAMDFLGNPVGLIGGIGDGVSDLFYEPINGITKSPKDFAEGLGRGVSSMGRHATYGLLGTVGSITSSLSTGVATLSLDRDYMKERKRRQRKKATGIGSGVMQAGSAVTGGVVEGFKGLVLKPVEGFNEGSNKFVGVGLGLGKGIIGVPVKLVSGVLDAFGKVSEGVKYSVAGKTATARRRPPRALVSGVVRPYSRMHADVHNTLMALGEDFKDDVIALLVIYTIDHETFEVSAFTNRHVVLFKITSGDTWVVTSGFNYLQVRKVTVESPTIVVIEVSGSSSVRMRMNADDGRTMHDLLELINKVLPRVPLEQFCFPRIGATKEATVEVWENERLYSRDFSKSMLPSDRAAWSDADGNEARTREQFSVPPMDCVWLTEWEVDKSKNADADGWMYAKDFGLGWTPSHGNDTFVRRRRWVRKFGIFEENLETSQSLVTMDRHREHEHKQDEAGKMFLSETYENERTYPLIGFTKKLLPTDRAQWSDRSGRKNLPKDSVKCPAGFKWMGGWQIDRSGNTDKEGWEYAVDFPFEFHASKKLMDSVRRRRWMRYALPEDA